MQLDDVYRQKTKLRRKITRAGFVRKVTDTAANLLGRARPPLQISIGVGFQENGEYCLAVRVRGATDFQREWISRILEWVPGAEVLETDPVRIISSAAPAAEALAAPLGIGSRIVHRFGARQGTLGFFARRIDNDTLGFVSNNHVIANEDRGTAGQEVVRPGRDIVGVLAEPYPKLFTLGVKTADCAFAALKPGIAVDMAALPGAGGPLVPIAANPRSDQRVFKIGSETGFREGRIKAFDFDTLTAERYRDQLTVRFENQIEIETTTGRGFSDPGDSGSLVFNSARQPIGLLFAETSTRGRDGQGLAYANPIGEVLRQLRVRVVTA